MEEGFVGSVLCHSSLDNDLDNYFSWRRRVYWQYDFKFQVLRGSKCGLHNVTKRSEDAHVKFIFFTNSKFGSNFWAARCNTWVTFARCDTTYERIAMYSPSSLLGHTDRHGLLAKEWYANHLYRIPLYVFNHSRKPGVHCSLWTQTIYHPRITSLAIFLELMMFLILFVHATLTFEEAPFDILQ